MSARLIQFVLDETARACVEQCPQNHVDGEFDEVTYDEQTQLGAESPELKSLPDGIYAVLIQADPLNSPTARFSLIEAETPKFIATAEFDLRPFMVSAIQYGEAYENVDEDNFLTLEHQISMERAKSLEGMFTPYIQNNTAFNLRLLDIIDYLTYPAILSKVEAYNLEEAQTLGPDESADIKKRTLKYN